MNNIQHVIYIEKRQIVCLSKRVEGSTQHWSDYIIRRLFHEQPHCLLKHTYTGSAMCPVEASSTNPKPDNGSHGCVNHSNPPIKKIASKTTVTDI